MVTGIEIIEFLFVGFIFGYIFRYIQDNFWMNKEQREKYTQGFIVCDHCNHYNYNIKEDACEKCGKRIR